MLELSGCTVDLRTGAVHGAGDVPLTDRERTLLAYLAARPSTVVPRDELLTEVWGYSDQVLTRAVDNAMRRLREKVEVDSANPRHLLTAWGTGYRFEPVHAAPETAPAAGTRSRRCLVLGDRTIDLDLGVVRSPGAAPAALTSTELAVIGYFAERVGRVVERGELVRAAWQGHSSRRAVDNLLYRLRAKIEPDPDAPRHLVTVRGAGYRLHVGATAPQRSAYTLVQIAVANEAELWNTAPEDAGRMLAELATGLESAAREADGISVGAGWRFAFAEPARALGFAVSILREPARALQVAVHHGRPVVWVDPVTGRASCLGPEVHRLEDLIRRGPPGRVVVDEGLWASIGAESGHQARPIGHGAVVIGGDPGSPVELPAVAGALPWIGDRFLGRDAELEALAGLSEGPDRLITLVGAPGVGKSRLALEALGRVDRPGVFFASLGGVTTVGGFVGAVAAALGVLLGREDPAEQLGNALAGQGPGIVWLDDIDHCAPVTIPILERWLGGAPDLTILATSRRALGLRGERIVPVEPLRESDGIALFVERASGRNVPDSLDVRTLVRELDGLPLAIELAAARTSVLSTRQLLDRLPDRLRLLARHDGPDRHRSVRAALDVSWALLDVHEAAALARCAVFEGGFTLELAEEVLEPQGSGTPWVVDVVEALVRHHLVRVDGHRYTLLDSVRAYAAERLAEDPGARLAADVALGRVMGRLGSREALAALRGPHGAEGFATLAAEVRNLERAITMAVQRGDGDLAAGAMLALAELRRHRGPFADGIAKLDQVLAIGPPRQWELLAMRGSLKSFAGDPSGSERDLEAALVGARADGDAATEATAELRLADVTASRLGRAAVVPRWRRAYELARSCGDLRVEGLAALGLAAAEAGASRIRGYEEALNLARLAGDLDLEGTALGMLGIAERDRGRTARARELGQAALEVHRRTGDRRGEALSLGNLGNTLRWEDPDAAAAYFRASRLAHRQIGSLRGEAYACAGLGMLHTDAGEHDSARASYEEATALAVRIGDRDNEALFRSNLGAMLIRLGRHDEAEEHLQRGLALAEDMGRASTIVSSVIGLTALPRYAGSAGLPLLDRAEELDGVDPELSLWCATRRAEVLWELGRPDEATAALDLAEQRLEALPSAIPADAPVLQELQEIRRRLRPRRPVLVRRTP